MENALMRFIHGSNHIESAGSRSLDITIGLCRAVFRGLPVSAEISPLDGDPAYYEAQKKAVFVTGGRKYKKGEEGEEEEGEEEDGNIDPCTLAAKYHHKFIAIHPFGDSNGRTSRLVISAILLGCAARVVCFGADDEERDEHIGVTYRGARRRQEEDLEVAPDRQKGHYELAGFILEKAKKENTYTAPRNRARARERASNCPEA